MWSGLNTDRVYEQLCTLTCVQHENRANEIDPSLKYSLTILFKNLFRILKIKALSFIFETDELQYYSQMVKGCIKKEGLFTIHDSPLALYNEVKLKDDILFLESVVTYTLSLLTQMCYFCNNMRVDSFIDDRGVCSLPLNCLMDNSSFNSSYIRTCCHKFYDYFKDEIFFKDLVLGANFDQFYDRVGANFTPCDTELLNFGFTVAFFTYFKHYKDDPIRFTLDVVESHELLYLKNTRKVADETHLHESALCVYSAVLLKSPYSYEALAYKAYAYLRIGDFSSAELHCRLALIIKSGWCRIYVRLVIALLCQDRIHESQSCAAFGIKDCTHGNCPDRENLEGCTDFFKENNLSNGISSVVKKWLILFEDFRDFDESISLSADSDITDVPDLTDSLDEDLDSGSETPTEDPRGLTLDHQIEENECMDIFNPNAKNGNTLPNSLLPCELRLRTSLKSKGILPAIAAVHACPKVELEISICEKICPFCMSDMFSSINVRPCEESIYNSLKKAQFFFDPGCPLASVEDTRRQEILGLFFARCFHSHFPNGFIDRRPSYEVMELITQQWTSNQQHIMEVHKVSHEDFIVIKRDIMKMVDILKERTKHRKYQSITDGNLNIKDIFMEVFSEQMEEFGKNVEASTEDVNSSSQAVESLQKSLETASEELKINEKKTRSEQKQLTVLSHDMCDTVGASTEDINGPSQDIESIQKLLERPSEGLKDSEKEIRSHRRQLIELSRDMCGTVETRSEDINSSCQDIESLKKLLKKTSEYLKAHERKTTSKMKQLTELSDDICDCAGTRTEGIGNSSQGIASMQKLLERASEGLETNDIKRTSQREHLTELSRDVCNTVETSSKNNSILQGNESTKLFLRKPHGYFKTSEKKTKNKKKQLTELSHDICDTSLHFEALTDFEKTLNDASEAAARGCWSSAMEHFSQAVDKARNKSKSYPQMKTDTMTIKFVYAYVCYRCSTYESINKAIKIFKEIIDSNPKEYAQSYFLLGLIYCKLHKYEDALKYFEILNTLDKSSYCLNVSNLLDDTAFHVIAYETIESTLKDEIWQCMHPPSPDALCRYEKCSLEPAIYITDFAFKNFVCIRCQERCVLQYHMVCWKAMKECFNKTDKEFLDHHCFTPDCNALIIKIEVVGKDGILQKDFVSEVNYKPKKAVKPKKNKISKLEKKHCQKEWKKPPARSRSVSESVTASIQECESVSVTINEPDRNLTPEGKSVCTSNNQPVKHDIKSSSELTVNAKPMYIIKKDTTEKECDKQASKHKGKKKQKKPIVSLENFVKGYSPPDTSNLSKQASEPTGVDIPGKNKFIEEKVSFTEDSYEANLSHSISIYFEQLLNDHGFLSLASPFLENAIENLNKEAKLFIERRGGFLKYIQCNSNFAIVKGTLCRFSDMMNVYRPDSFSQECSMQVGIENGGVLIDSLSNKTVTYAEKIKLHNHDVPVFSRESKADALDDSFDSNVNYEFGNSLIPSDLLQIDGDNRMRSVSVFPMHSEKFLLNPNATEYNPCKQNTSEYDCTNQEISHLEDMSTILCDTLSETTSDLSSHDIEKLQIPTESCVNVECVQPGTSAQMPRYQNLQKVEEIKSYGDQVKPLVEYFNRHFNDLMDKNDFDGIQKSYTSLMRLLQQMGFNHSIAIQVDIPAASVVSQDVVKHEEELEEQLSFALDEQARLQRQYQIDILNLKEEIQNNEEIYMNELEDMRKKHAILEEDLKTWNKKYDDLVEGKNKLNTTNKIQKVHLEDCTRKFKNYEERITSLTRELQLLHIKRDEENEYADQLANTNADLLTTNTKLKSLEFEILRVKKIEFTKVYNIHLAYTREKMNDLKLGMLRVESLSPEVHKAVQMFETELNEVTSNIHSVYVMFMNDISEQEQELRNGVPLSQLENLETPSFPEIPTINYSFQSGSENTFLYPHSLVNSGSAVSNSPLVDNNAFRRSAENVLNCDTGSVASSYLNNSGRFNSSYEQQSFNFNKNANQQMRTHSILNQSNPLQDSNIPLYKHSFLSQSSMLPGDEPIPRPVGYGSQFCRSVSSIPEPMNRTENKAFMCPPGLTSSSASHGNIGSSSDIAQLNIVQEPSPFKLPSSTASYESPLNVMNKNLTYSSASECHTKKPSFPLEKAAYKSVANSDSKTASDVHLLKFGYAGPKSASVDTAVSNLKTQDNVKSDADAKAAARDKINKGISRVLELLLVDFPNKTESELMTAVKEYREQKGRLANIPIITVVENVKKILLQAEETKSLATADFDPQNKCYTTSVMLSSNPPSWTNVSSDGAEQLNVGGSFFKEKPCSICLEKISKGTSFKVACGHVFHNTCIMGWLHKQSNCPECRTHLLLPDDFFSVS